LIPSGIKVIGVQGIVDEIFLMLIKNAVDAMEPDEKERKPATVPQSNADEKREEGPNLIIDAAIDAHSNSVNIFIKDRGRGELSKIKSILAQTNTGIPSTRMKSGTKYHYGIYFSRELLNYLRGDLSYDGNEGGGITTIITLPLEEEEMQ
jgi:signal transduction histidine kinase